MKDRLTSTCVQARTSTVKEDTRRDLCMICLPPSSHMFHRCRQIAKVRITFEDERRIPRGKHEYCSFELIFFQPSTHQSDPNQAQWYKQMYNQLHRPPETRPGKSTKALSHSILFSARLRKQIVLFLDKRIQSKLSA